MTLTELTTVIDDFVWGVPLLVLLMGVGILISFRIGFRQFSGLIKGFKYMVKEEPGVEKGEITSFAAFCTAMSATVGTGNIVGVATAIVVGGPGALFWMIIAALIGMGTKYAECLLAVKYRTVDEDGHVLGGPFMYIEKGMGKNWKWLSSLFAVFIISAGLLGIGTMTQTNGVVSAASAFFDPDSANVLFTFFGKDITVVALVAAIIVTLAAALVIIGGIKRISTVSSYVVPFMAVLYIVVTLCVVVFNFRLIPSAVTEIVRSAFGADAVAGGMLGAMMLAVQKGVARGCFSNEAGLGSAPIAVAAAQAKEPVRQGLVNSVGVFIDTVIICTLTGLSIVITQSHTIGVTGAAVTINALGTGLPWNFSVGAFILMVCLAFFAFTTILGWQYYSERSLEYLTGKKDGSTITVFRWVYILFVFIGPFLSVDAVWNIADICNGLIAIPNLIGVLALSGVVAAETKDYFARLKSGTLDDGLAKK